MNCWNECGGGIVNMQLLTTHVHTVWRPGWTAEWLPCWSVWAQYPEASASAMWPSAYRQTYTPSAPPYPEEQHTNTPTNRYYRCPTVCISVGVTSTFLSYCLYEFIVWTWKCLRIAFFLIYSSFSYTTVQKLRFLKIVSYAYHGICTVQNYSKNSIIVKNQYYFK